MEARAVLHLLPSGERHFGSSHSRSNKLKACHNQQPVPWHLVRTTLFSAKASARRQIPPAWEGLKFSHDLYHGLAFEETASHPPPLPFAASLCLCLLCSTDPSDSHRIRSHGWQGVAMVKRSRWMMGCQSVELRMPTLRHLENFSCSTEPRVWGSKTLADWLTDLCLDNSVLELCHAKCGPWTRDSGSEKPLLSPIYRRSLFPLFFWIQGFPNLVVHYFIWGAGCFGLCFVVVVVVL